MPKKAAKSDKRPVLGSKLAAQRSTSSNLHTKKIHSVQVLSSTKAPPVRNTLDSTAPTIKRGKEREKPKKKRPTKLRKIILDERAERQKLRHLESAYYDPLNTHVKPETDTDIQNKDPSSSKFTDQVNCMKTPKEIISQVSDNKFG